MAEVGNEARRFVRAIYAFKGSNNDELNFKKGDIITVSQSVDGGWWEGTLGGVTGWFPCNYVKDIPTTEALNQINGGATDNSEKNRTLILKDIIESEKHHVDGLKQFIAEYLNPLKESEILSPEQFNCLIGSYIQIQEAHEKFLSQLQSVENYPSALQRIGGAHVNFAPILKSLLVDYCENHPRSARLIEQYKNELGGFMESHNEKSGVMFLTTNLSKPFRYVERYCRVLKDLERHLEESHVDRGDTQRAIEIYRNLFSTCISCRRQKEMELEVMEGTIKNWEGESIHSLGEIVLMSAVTTITNNSDKKDRYLVLFPTTLVMLSPTPRMSAFMYEGKLPLSGIKINHVPASETMRYAFEIMGSFIEKITVCFQSKEELNHWLLTISSQVRNQNRNLQVGLHSQSSSPIAAGPKQPLWQSGYKIWSKSHILPSTPTRQPITNQQFQRNTSYFSFRESPTKNKLKREHSFNSSNCDYLTMQVIEAYCTSAKNRNTLAASSVPDNPQIIIAEEEKIIVEEFHGDQVIVQEKTLVDTVYAMEERIRSLQTEVGRLTRGLEAEVAARARLEDLVRLQMCAQGSIGHGNASDLASED